MKAGLQSCPVFAGCVIAELFTEGVPLFDLSQLLAYRKGNFQTEHVLLKIEDQSVRELVIITAHTPEHTPVVETYGDKLTNNNNTILRQGKFIYRAHFNTRQFKVLYRHGRHQEH